MIKASKTDQIQKGFKVFIGSTGNDLCPVAAFMSYLVMIGDRPGPLFQWDDQRPLSKIKVVEHIHLALLSANLPAHLYVGHSFRKVWQPQHAQLQLELKTPPFRFWEGGRAHLIYSMLDWILATWPFVIHRSKMLCLRE